ncbi:PREDICTED: probable transmembrane ascorbate ferrireductase 2 isoform X2 [Camelina sativa]|uniref:Probable transmembrane ascorbate ferrireductase 2 isoform X2 n=1 Tax=Camelina sativa TaxID=90675 RepID=A0ABM0U4Q7_CAMSA|nr:PREDICTED: probable transmembrane ascorbate ferrireductase 2 isoform X2 [Camelina sativa]XP_010440996.1 PREDICTED: probable transmembrane ascorbate ferrireductase 2 isoform X2 [Camelina sativa]XP_010450888.1 PREDICTED: probable transmembrane ascorbate ferrireductase 2 isoform X2 [Camelina sativa]
MAVPMLGGFPIFLVVRVLGFIIAALVLTWTVHYRGGLALSSDNKDHIFNVHPVMMVIGLILFNGEAFILSLIGVWAALKFHIDKGIENFYSLHSWLGLACLFLFAFQWAAGFVTYWYPGGSRNSRVSLMPWHVFLGIYIYALALVTATTGILEKLTFLQVNQVITRYSTEAMLVNTTGVLILVLGGFVILGVVTPVNGKDQVLTQ